MNSKNYDIKTALIESGRREFLEKGYERSSLRTICREAGVTTGAFYNYFLKKEDLFMAVVGPALESIRRAIRDASGMSAAAPEPADGGLPGACAEAIAAALLKNRDNVRLIFECSAGSGLDREREELIEELSALMRGSIREYAPEMTDSAELDMLLSVSMSCLKDVVYGGGSVDDTARKAAAVDVFFRGGLSTLSRAEGLAAEGTAGESPAPPPCKKPGPPADIH